MGDLSPRMGETLFLEKIDITLENETFGFYRFIEFSKNCTEKHLPRYKTFGNSLLQWLYPHRPLMLSLHRVLKSTFHLPS